MLCAYVPIMKYRTSFLFCTKSLILTNTKHVVEHFFIQFHFRETQKGFRYINKYQMGKCNKEHWNMPRVGRQNPENKIFAHM